MKPFSFRYLLGPLFLLLFATAGFAVEDKDLPARPSPQRLVNDMAGMMNPQQQEELERLLVNFDNTTSSQVAVVTVPSLDGHDVAEYSIALFNKWGIGRKGKNNGILIFASAGDRKMWITTGYGLEGALTDAQAGRIVRNEMIPQFKAGNYYKGFENAANAVIAATKGEYTNEDPPDAGSDNEGGARPFIIVFIVIIVIIIAAIRGGGGKGGGGYMSRRGSRAGDFITGAILGSLLNGGNSGSSGWGGGSGGGFGGGGGGGFGGFGGGSSGGGGAGGSW